MSGEDNIVEKFKDAYSALYNSSESSEDLMKLKDILREEISADFLNEVNKITGQSVKEASCRMKPRKSDVSSSYTSDAILNAPDIFFDMIALVYKSCMAL